MKKDLKLYYAIFSPDEENSEIYNISFPDLPGALSFGEGMSDALYMAKDLLAGFLLGMIEDGENLPAPSSYPSISHEDSELVVPIEVDLSIYKDKFENKLVKKTLSIPAYLNTLGIEEGVNFSQLLTKALKETLEE